MVIAVVTFAENPAFLNNCWITSKHVVSTLQGSVKTPWCEVELAGFLFWVGLVALPLGDLENPVTIVSVAKGSH